MVYKVIHTPTNHILQTEFRLTNTKGYRIYHMKASNDSYDAIFYFKISAYWRLWMIAIKTHRHRNEFLILDIKEDFGL